MKPNISSVGTAVILALAAYAPTQAAPVIKEIFSLGGGGIGGGLNHIFRVDLLANTVVDLGSSGIGPSSFTGGNCFPGTLQCIPTNLAMSANRTLYYMAPFEVPGGGHDLYRATLNITSTALVGAPTLVTHLPTTGFNIIDGLTVGPDGNLYMTGYGKSEIYRYNPTSGTFNTVVKLIGGGEFRSDLAFDPITGNLVGIGIEPGSTDRTLFEIPQAIAINSVNGVYTWAYYGGPGSPWALKQLDNSSTDLGGNPDGVAFDPTNGDLYLSGDGTGIYAYDRNTAVRGAVIPLTASSYLNGLGYDLAMQALDAPIPTPTSISLALAALALLTFTTTKKKHVIAASSDVCICGKNSN